MKEWTKVQGVLREGQVAMGAMQVPARGARRRRRRATEAAATKEPGVTKAATAKKAASHQEGASSVGWRCTCLVLDCGAVFIPAQGKGVENLVAQKGDESMHARRMSPVEC